MFSAKFVAASASIISKRFDRPKDGRLLNISLTVSPIRNAQGTIIGVSKIARDITEKKRFEREREELLARERLMREQLAAALEARDEFIAVAAHELRNPLNVFQLSLHVLHRLAGDPASKDRMPRFVEKCQNQLKNMASLIDRLLDVTRIRTGTFELVRETGDLSSLHSRSCGQARVGWLHQSNFA